MVYLMTKLVLILLTLLLWFSLQCHYVYLYLCLYLYLYLISKHNDLFPYLYVLSVEDRKWAWFIQDSMLNLDV